MGEWRMVAVEALTVLTYPTSSGNVCAGNHPGNNGSMS